MGNWGMSPCSGSVTFKESDDPALTLTTRQIEVVRQTWKVIEQDLGANGVLIFNKFFEVAPEVKALFPKIIVINPENKLVEETDQKMLLRHATTVMEGFGAAVESLDDTYVLDSVLVALGQTHARRNVNENMLKKLWPALLHGLKASLGPRFNKETSEAWKTLYQYVCMRMREGMVQRSM